ncbi:hypothetical protein GCM10007392_29020 [Saccharospirillum salsuginis]|uniref:Uncharacterized protein n=1 Tax=Saccharospirillum salsuginis TaxID=418750 RepID=A0A918KDI8_9GAMM|nr:hypothetical protein GCM10007392_29020 [Saccharospirillum salsuginis]
MGMGNYKERIGCQAGVTGVVQCGKASPLPMYGRERCGRARSALLQVWRVVPAVKAQKEPSISMGQRLLLADLTR